MYKQMYDISQLRVVRLQVIINCFLCALLCFPNLNNVHSSTEEYLLRARPCVRSWKCDDQETLDENKREDRKSNKQLQT